MPDRVQGLVIRVTGHEIWVEIGGRTIPCVLRGRFRQEPKSFQVVAGDGVEIAYPDAAGAQGTIEALLPRRTWLSRYSGGRDVAERVIVANIDTLVIITSLRSPRLNFGFLDRALVSAEQGHNEVCICLNKVDLIKASDKLPEFLDIYGSVGYKLIKVSAKTGDGIDRIESLLEGGVYAFVGQSGVGKSSLLNRIDDTLNLKVRQVAGKTGRGRHTTSYSQLFPMRGGYVADTPGMQTFGFPGTDKRELALCFPEFRRYVDECRFQPCTHSHEPDCAVKEALDEGAIHKSRYRSYLNMLAEIDDRAKERY